ncbi:MAG: LptF/LptG family permease [Elusimicrobiota bacterium]|nr:LptF/LptG family permease [Elusimicrobiota bacterium]
MRIFNRYIFKEFLPVFATSFFILTGIFIVNEAMGFIASLVVKGAGFIDIAKIFGTGIPASFVFVIPVSFVISWVVTLSRLAGDSEILALQSSGVNPRIILKSVLVSSVLVSLFMLYSNSVLSPKSSRKMTVLVREILSRNILHFREGAFSKVGDYIFYAEGISSKEMRDIRIYRRDGNFPAVSVTAKTGSLPAKGNGPAGFTLKNGRMTLKNKDDHSLLTTIDFHKYSFFIDSPEHTSGSRNISQLESSKLRTRIKEMEKKGHLADNLKMEYHMRPAMAWGVLFLSLIGAILGIKLKSPKKASGIGAAILLLTIYYLGFSLCSHIAESGWIPPLLAVWMPNLLCGIGALLAL